MDFTIKAYKTLLNSLQNQDYQFQTFGEYLQNSASRTIILRHDVDKLPENSLIFAQIQHKLGIKGSYFFRIVPQSFDEKIIKKIAELGHEIGYHYEDVVLASKKIKVKRQKYKRRAEGEEQREKSRGKSEKREKEIRGESVWSSGSQTSTQYLVPSTQKDDLYDLAIESFQRNLEALRKIVPVKTICMHGSPMGRYDNRDLWKKYDYRDFGIIGEPYFDLDFGEVLYLTDTGRKWNGEKVSIRDKEINHKEHKPAYAKASAGKGDTEVAKESLSSKYNFKTTFDIIRAAENGDLPDRIMMTFHPQRWTDGYLPWIKEFILQNLKNVVKRTLISIRK